jgi:DNA adenine methylase
MKRRMPELNRRLVHFSPLRYPGGKGKLAPFVKSLIVTNGLSDGEYVEPFAGGAAVAMELLLQEYVAHVHINDISRPVFAFWKSVVSQTDALCKRVRDTPLTIRAWDKQKAVLMNAAEYDDLALGFATFYLNRTNRSGILNGGIIGGREQTGGWKIDARYNAPELINRITSIARMKHRISVTRQDALKFLTNGLVKWPKKTLVYLDPPYYEKARDLYYDFYKHDDHAAVARFVQRKIRRQRWLVSYDDAAPIRSLYADSEYIVYKVGYSARRRSEGAEIMFFDDGLMVPPLVGPVSAVSHSTGARE